MRNLVKRRLYLTSFFPLAECDLPKYRSRSSKTTKSYSYKRRQSYGRGLDDGGARSGVDDDDDIFTPRQIVVTVDEQGLYWFPVNASAEKYGDATAASTAASSTGIGAASNESGLLTINKATGAEAAAASALQEMYPRRKNRDEGLYNFEGDVLKPQCLVIRKLPVTAREQRPEKSNQTFISSASAINATDATPHVPPRGAAAGLEPSRTNNKLFGRVWPTFDGQTRIIVTTHPA